MSLEMRVKTPSWVKVDDSMMSPWKREYSLQNHRGCDQEEMFICMFIYKTRNGGPRTSNADETVKNRMQQARLEELELWKKARISSRGTKKER